MDFLRKRRDEREEKRSIKKQEKARKAKLEKERLERNKKLEELFIEKFKMTMLEFISYDGSLVLTRRLKAVLEITPARSSAPPYSKIDIVLGIGCKFKLSDNFSNNRHDWKKHSFYQGVCIDIIDKQISFCDSDRIIKIKVELEDLAEAVG